MAELIDSSPDSPVESNASDESVRRYAQMLLGQSGERVGSDPELVELRDVLCHIVAPRMWDGYEGVGPIAQEAMRSTAEPVVMGLLGDDRIVVSLVGAVEPAAGESSV